MWHQGLRHICWGLPKSNQHTEKHSQVATNTTKKIQQVLKKEDEFPGNNGYPTSSCEKLDSTLKQALELDHEGRRNCLALF